ncbi:SERPINE1 mRNA-binding protein 1 [Drosophila kikkawai]|uniref:SERPINE1 mRNA-binding protein 1 n=1 Tax=Drosophila kikkawai TaxID=30033 RepID=A0A6P4IDQ9_DROKI|nr:plasminogen activator inhibitor 1 RNA-binding protein [Drosophila kikkawai]
MDNSGNNRYELLFMDDDAPPQIPVAAVTAAPAKKPEASAPKAPKSKPEKENKPVGAAAAKKANNAVSKTAGGTSPVKGGKAGPPPRNANAPAGNGERNFNARSNNNNNQRNFGGNRDAGEFGNELPQRQFNNRDNRGPPRVRAGEKFGKREFDRQSGSDKTGVKAIDKREGGGAHNWGSPKQDIEDQKTGESAPQADKEDSANEQSADPAAVAEEDESKQMTLDEWKALRDQRAKPNYNLRKAGEGVENPEWKKMVVLSKKKESNSEDEMEYDPSLYPQRVGRLQRIVDIQFNFNDGRKAGGFRKGPRPGVGGPREGGFRNDGPREGGFRNDGPREGGYRNDGPREGGYRNDGPRGNGPRYNSGASNGYDRQDNNNRIGEKRRSGQKPLKVDDEAQFPTLC